ncbi:MAG: DUF4203 domain-containing protein [Nitrospiraceae bacterium]|nr:DUF4203 domain-containing protein [Nitrospiraceae bacterium]
MTLFRLLLGIALLAAGRNLFWLFLGGTGFILGFDLAGRLVHGQPQGVMFVIAVVAGVACALLALFLQKLAIIVAGFIAGGYLLPALVKEFGVSDGHYHWLLFIVGGIVGALLMKVFFNWALIILSSVVGSNLIIEAVHFGPQIRKLFFVCLLLLGIVIQTGITQRKTSPRPR